jgi:hypothetical protein
LEPGIDPLIFGSSAWKPKTILFDAIGHQHFNVLLEGRKKDGLPPVHGVAKPQVLQSKELQWNGLAAYETYRA